LATGGWPLRHRSSSSWSSHSGIACKKNDDELLHVVPENVAAGLRRLPSIPLHRLRGCDEGNSLTEKTFLRLVVRFILFVTVLDEVALSWLMRPEIALPFVNVHCWVYYRERALLGVLWAIAPDLQGHQEPGYAPRSKKKSDVGCSVDIQPALRISVQPAIHNDQETEVYHVGTRFAK
jgi:hypothetical protein